MFVACLTSSTSHWWHTQLISLLKFWKTLFHGSISKASNWTKNCLTWQNKLIMSLAKSLVHLYYVSLSHCSLYGFQSQEDLTWQASLWLLFQLLLSLFYSCCLEKGNRIFQTLKLDSDLCGKLIGESLQVFKYGEMQ